MVLNQLLDRPFSSFLINLYFILLLPDMGSLIVETVHTSTQIPFGKALVSEITQLTASHPVNV